MSSKFLFVSISKDLLDLILLEISIDVKLYIDLTCGMELDLCLFHYTPINPNSLNSRGTNVSIYNTY